eukprot:m51a1_g14101 hypothetical protein (270) ;mRNA; r:94413-95706
MAVRVYAVADLHVDYPENAEWVASQRGDRDGCLLVAGDLTDSLPLLERTLLSLLPKYLRLFFVPGNHDLWLRDDEGAFATSVEKLDAVLGLCQRLGVETAPAQVSAALAVVPLLSWYETPPSPDSLYERFAFLDDDPRVWRDFWLCKWPPGLATSEQRCSHYSGTVISFSHFFSHREQMVKHSEPWRNYCGPSSGFPNFTAVAGSQKLGRQIDVLRPAFHIFGHSHRALSYTSTTGTQFLNVPLAYPSERQNGKVPSLSEPALVFTATV